MLQMRERNLLISDKNSVRLISLNANCAYQIRDGIPQLNVANA